MAHVHPLLTYVAWMLKREAPILLLGSLGAVFVLLADIATRLIHTSSELRLGVITSLVGAPFFFWLVVRLKRVSP